MNRACRTRVESFIPADSQGGDFTISPCCFAGKTIIGTDREIDLYGGRQAARRVAIVPLPG